MTTVDDVTLTEQADAAFTEGHLEDALRRYLRVLRADPRDLYVWYRAAALLGRLGERDAAVASLDRVAARFAESGQLMLALAAARELLDHAPDAGRERIRAVAELYAAGSPRLDRRHRAPPPPIPDRLADGGDEAAGAADLRVLRELVVDACAEALRRAGEAPAGGPLPAHPLLSDLAAPDLAALAPLMELRAVRSGEVVIAQGTEGRSFFIVVRGVVRVSLRTPAGEEVPLARLRAGAFFGEMALLTDSPRVASVTCETPVLLVELSRAELEDLAARSEGVASVLAAYTRDRLLRNLMAVSPLFQPLDQRRRETLIDLFESQVYPAGALVLDEGQPSEGLFVVLSGAVRVSRKDSGEELKLAELGPGQIFGEISLIQKRAATATVKALTKTVLLSLARATFNEHVRDFPEVVAHVYQVAVEREQRNLQLEAGQPVQVDEELLLI